MRFPFRPLFLALALVAAAFPAPAQNRRAREPAPDPDTEAAAELNRAIADAGNDSRALVHNLQDYLRRFPASPARASVYRALIEAQMELGDQRSALDYAERLIALQPDDAELMLFTLRLLREQGGDDELRRAAGYATRILDRLENVPPDARPPGVPPEEWDRSRRSLAVSLYLMRGELHMERGDYAAAESDLARSYSLAPNPEAALRLGELAELAQSYDRAIEYYAAAFVLPDTGGGPAVNRADVRRKIANLWRARHGSEAGLGERLLGAYDQINARAAGLPPDPPPNEDATHPHDFLLRRPGGGSSYALSAARGKVVVLDFWATWCVACRPLRPLLEQLRLDYAGRTDVVFLAVNYGGEDDARIAEFLARRPIGAAVVRADGLDRLLDVQVVPTLIVLDGEGRVSFRGSGFDPASFAAVARAAVERALAALN